MHAKDLSLKDSILQVSAISAQALQQFPREIFAFSSSVVTDRPQYSPFVRWLHNKKRTLTNQEIWQAMECHHLEIIWLPNN